MTVSSRRDRVAEIGERPGGVRRWRFTTTRWAGPDSSMGGRGSRGSRPRCVLMVDGGREDVAERLTRLVDLPGVAVSAQDRWQPRGRPVRLQDSWDTTPSDEIDLARPNELVFSRYGAVAQIMVA